MAAQVLMPIAPHIAEEVWHLLGCQENLSTLSYPTIDERLLQDDTVTYVVQVNGKLRGRFELPKDQPEAVILEKAQAHPQILKYLEGVSLEKVIFVPNKLLNLVVK